MMGKEIRRRSFNDTAQKSYPEEKIKTFHVVLIYHNSVMGSTVFHIKRRCTIAKLRCKIIKQNVDVRLFTNYS